MACVYTTDDGTDWDCIDNQLITINMPAGPGIFVGGTDNCTTNATGCCTVQITSSTAGTTTIEATADIVVGGGGIVGVITDGSGNPVPGASVCLDPPDPFTCSTSATTDEHGFYYFPKVTIGGHEVCYNDS
jgi:hypothetical protein